MVSGVSTAAGLESNQFNRKETNEHRTSNIERPTSNNVFCQFIKKTDQAYSAEGATEARSESTFRNSRSLDHVFSVIRLILK
jgi:hypothetical protein